MWEIDISPELIYPFQPDIQAWDSLMRYLQENGWKWIPRVPIFEIPDKYRFQEHPALYILLDGNHRHEWAMKMSDKLPCFQFDYGAIIDCERHKLAPFRHSNHPKVYERLLKIYQAQALAILPKI